MERRSSTRFSPSEIARMEKLVSDKKEVLVDSFARSFRSAARVEVELYRLHSSEEKIALDTSISNNEDALSPDLPKETTDKVPEFEDLQFEAKSSKDSAW
ncbi:hypothetical protein ZWY2020_039283 [Hordeum vulgare]|nr:hypothetical protein ZWY2020_039283 [Hordeum vulgare]